MSTTHTPGPWIVENDTIIIGHDNVLVADTFTTPFDRHIDEDKANARLIAAAPDLLEALKEMIKLVGALKLNEIPGPAAVHGAVALKKANQAIKKAGGIK